MNIQAAKRFDFGTL